MSTLQVGLAIAGALVLAAIVAHGAWASRRMKPRQADPTDQAADPAGGPIEPHLEPDTAPEPSMALPAAERRPSLDPLIDAIAPIALETEVSGEAALAALPPTRRAGSKPFAVEGLNSLTRVWEAPAPGARYDAFQAGVQLANRLGALNEIEFSEFTVKVQGFCDAVAGTPELPDMLEVVARARELDQFAGANDAQLEFSLRARRAAWSPGYVQQHAARLGFVAGAIPGRLALPGAVAGAPAVLSLSFDPQAALADDPAQAALREVRLSLDVAQVERAETPFVRMREVARALSEAMDAEVTDDNGRPLQADAMDVIGGELERIYDALEQRELPVGSPQARRLFS